MKKFISILSIPNFDSVSISDAKALFSSYKSRGVILNDSFDDDKWTLTNELSRIGFAFEIEDFSEMSKYIHMKECEFIDYMKTYAVFRIGELNLTSIQSILLGIRKIVDCPIEDIGSFFEETCVTYATRINEFFSMLPTDGRETELENINSKLEELEDLIYEPVNYNNQRVLASFETYFLFDALLDKFWTECKEVHEKLFYFPLWLWWKLTAVIPTRPTAFTLTPRNCVYKDGDAFFIKMRQSILKGKDKRKSYKINEDYREVSYEIPTEMAYMIQWYIRETEDFDANPLNTLFRLKPHYKHWEQKEHANSIYYTYTNLSTCLRYFYSEIIRDRFGYKIIYDKGKSFLSDGEIQYINLGDTRHLSMINLISSGATAMVAQVLAGHENIDISSHYFSNVKQMIKCRIRIQYSKRLAGQKSYSLALKTKTMFSGKEYINVEGGRCYSKKASEYNFDDCSNAIGDNATIGVCEKCDFFLPEGLSFREKENMYETEIDTELENLKQIVNRVRLERGYSEEIEQSLKKLRTKELSYQQYLIEMMKEQDNEAD